MLLFLLAILLCSAEVSDGIDCSVTFPLSQLPDNCTTMTGDLMIDGRNTSYQLINHLQYSVLVQKLSHVEQWTGSIKILNTDFHNLTFFNSLKSVKASWPYIILDEHTNYASFWIESNANLTSLAMPNLVDVQADVLPTNSIVYSLLIRENKNLCLDEVEFLRLRVIERSFLFDFRMCGPTIQKYCFTDFFGPKNIPLGCQILMTGIWIKDETNTSLQSYLNEAFSTVEEVHGPIVIFRTDFTNLSFPVLHTIRNQFYDGQNSWQWQLLIVRGNYFLKSIRFPKLRNLFHYGSQPQLTNSANTNWSYTKEDCDTVRRFPFFSVTDSLSNCGLIPIMTDSKGESAFPLKQIMEKVASFLFNLGLCIVLTVKMFRSNISVNFFHFAMVTLICLTMIENLYVNLDYIHLFNEKGFALPFGIRSLLITHDATLFNQISNIMYVNRLSLLVSCGLYRSMYLSNPAYDQYGIVISCLIFIISNVCNLTMMQSLENKYTYVLNPFNWITLVFTHITGIYIWVLTMKKTWFGTDEMKKQQNQLSKSLFLQALWTFLFCGYSEGLNQFFAKNYQFVEYVRRFETFFYWYGEIIIRWHYSMLVLIIIAFLPSTFVKFPQSAKVTTMGSASKN